MSKDDPIQYISSLNNILAQAFTELYTNQPPFPITYLAKWLKQYSKGQDIKK